MVEIRKKIWPEFFRQMLGKKRRIEWRLADFDLQNGDVLVLEEWDPKTKKYTGRKIKKRCKFVLKIGPTDFYKMSHIKKYGFYIIQFE